MDAQLFICTWLPDLGWLRNCLLSVQRHWKSAYQPFIVANSDCEPHMKAVTRGIPCTVVYEPQLEDHHRGQIHIKMNADQYVDAPLILITDSDCLFTRVCAADDFAMGGKPIVTMEAYSTLIPRSIPQDQNCFACYKSTIGTVLHLLAEHEYMRRHPFLFYRDHIIEVRKRIEELCGKPLLEVMGAYHSGYFSEFNMFGAYCYHYYHDEYYWQDINSAPEPIVRQFHSHSQDTTSLEIGREVRKILS